MATLEGYEIFAELKRGPWVAIYKALDLRRQKTVLIKTLLHRDAPAAVQEQLSVERELRRRLQHPNLRAVYAGGRIDERAYLVLEYVEGPTLAELLAHNLPVELCAWITKEIAQALAAIHRQGLLHRDVKPQNIFVAQNGEVKLGDLGLAIEFNESSMSLAGTPAYFSPELILGQNLSERSDLFSLGAVLYEMLTAAAPFADHTTSAILHRIANLEPTPPEKLRPEVPPELAGLCRKLLAKNPLQRCQGAEEVLLVLAQFEEKYRLQLSAKNLAQFLERPQEYAPVEFRFVVEREHAASPQRPIRPLQKTAAGTSQRRFVPFALATAILCGFILMNFENKATENPAAPAAGDPASGIETASPVAAPTSANGEKKESATTMPDPAAGVFWSEQTQPKTPAAQSLPSAAEMAAPTDRIAFAKGSDLSPSVLLLSEPRAEVFAENDFLGLTPVRWTPSRSDHVYELRFVSPALPQINKLVAATIIESDTFALNLWDELAYLEIAVNPWGEIWVDGKAVDTTPLAKPLALAPGLHELDIRHPQLGTRRQRLVLVKGDTLRKFINLFTP